MKFSTKAIHVGNEPNLKDGGAGDVVIPIHLSTTFARKKVGVPTAGYEYSRTGNPTRNALEKNMAQVEGGKYAFAFSSGLAATTTFLLLLSKGDHVIAVDDLYAGIRRIFNEFTKFGVSFDFRNLCDLNNVNKLFQKSTKYLWIESPTNPLLKIVDIKKICKIAHQYGVKVVVDNTFASPYFQKPLTLGADIVVYSATKYLGGHSDVVGGIIVTSDDSLAKQIKYLQNAAGAILSPFDSYQLLKGIKTLEVRMRQHEENAQKIVAYLNQHKKVKKIYYPGLPSHQGYEIAKKQMTGFGGMVSFELDSTYQKTIRFLEALKIIAIAESLGAVESLIEHPASMTHAYLSEGEKREIGLSDTLIRLSVGIESVEDLIEDIDQALYLV